MANYPTPHIDAKPGDFGQTVLMPGDPLRAKFIAENFLQDAVLVNNVRGIQGYTGTYGGTKISVMASGMGMPSIGIYSWELYTVFGVENIMRIGSTGALQDSIKLRDHRHRSGRLHRLQLGVAVPSGRHVRPDCRLPHAGDLRRDG